MIRKPPRRPVVQPPPPWRFPEPGRAVFDNGVTVLTYDIPGQHVLSLRVAVPSPLSEEPQHLEGVGTIMARTLDEGTAAYDAEEMAELLERHGIALGAGISERGLVVDLDVTRRHLPAALDLLREALLLPTFPDAQVRRHVRTRIAQIEQEYATPGHRAAIAFADAYYPHVDRRSRPTGGSIASVSRIEREDVQAYHRRVVRPTGSTVVVAGDLGDLDIVAMIGGALGEWSAAPEVVRPESVVPAPSGEPRIVLVDRPGSVQSELYVGCPGPDRTVPGGWAPYPVLGFILGGSPQARLDAVLREEKGYTYGMRCGFRPRPGGGIFVASGSVRADVTAEALGLTLDILDAGRDGFTDDEVTAGVDFLCQTAPGRYATADAVADEASARSLEGRTTADTTAVLLDMREVTAKRLRKAYRSYVDGSWTSIVVGDAASLRKALKKLHRGEVTVVDS